MQKSHRFASNWVKVTLYRGHRMIIGHSFWKSTSQCGIIVGKLPTYYIGDPITSIFGFLEPIVDFSLFVFLDLNL